MREFYSSLVSSLFRQRQFLQCNAVLAISLDYWISYRTLYSSDSGLNPMFFASFRCFHLDFPSVSLSSNTLPFLDGFCWHTTAQNLVCSSLFHFCIMLDFFMDQFLVVFKWIKFQVKPCYQFHLPLQSLLKDFWNVFKYHTNRDWNANSFNYFLVSVRYSIEYTATYIFEVQHFFPNNKYWFRVISHHSFSIWALRTSNIANLLRTVKIPVFLFRSRQLYLSLHSLCPWS